MNLVTTASPSYFDRSLPLLRSFRQFYPNDRIIYVYFGGLTPSLILSSISDIVAIEVPRVTPYAWDPRYFFFKAYAYKIATELSDSFLYLDSRHRILGEPKEIEQSLDTLGRFLVPYPPIPSFHNEVHTSSKCFSKMECNSPRFRSAQHYWAAIHAWKVSPLTIMFFNELYNWMLDEEIAGPPNTIEKPDSSICLHHRNDQSVFSILIEKYKIGTQFSEELVSKYGDIETLRAFGLNIRDKRIIAGRRDDV